MQYLANYKKDLLNSYNYVCNKRGFDFLMSKIKSIIQKIYILIAYFSIFSILTLVNIFHLFTESAFVVVENIFISAIILLLFIAINYFLCNKIKKINIKIILISLIIVFLVLEILSIYFFKVKYNWDFKWIMDSAKDIATKGTTENIFYFKIFPNNLGVLIIVTLAMKIFGGAEIGAYIINTIFICLAVIFAILSSQKIAGEKCALITMILLLCVAPLYLYSPIVYTDTLSVAFPVMTLYLWMVAKEQKEKSLKRYFILLVGNSIISALGYCIKPIAAIVFVAIIIDELFMNKKNIKDIFIEIIIFVMIISIFNLITSKVIIKDNRKNEYEYPITHWIMMGLGKPENEGGTSIGYGAYNQKDSDYTASSGNYEEKKQANIKKIKERLKDFGIKDYCMFLLKKCKYVWNDGTYYVLKVIGWDTINTESIPYKIVLGEKSNISINVMTHINNTLFIIILINFILDIKKETYNQVNRVLGISIVGIAIFLLIWEARSRYIYFMIPIFCILGANGVEEALNCLKKLGRN